MWVPEKMACEPLVHQLVAGGLVARYVSDEGQYRHELANLDRLTVLIYVRDGGEDVILLGDNEIDHVRFRYRPGRASIRE